jgi:RsiW-degrading membrane proteinase PrsW (M82 family)
MSGLVIVSLVLGVMPGIIWLFIYLQEDDKNEPVSLVIRTFIAGAFTAFIALALQGLVHGKLTTSNPIVSVVLLTLVFAGIEEVCKFLAAFFTVRGSEAFDEPVDAMLYPIIAALGFATVENLAVAHTAAIGPSLAPVFQALTLRFIGATLLHSLASGIVGFLWGESLLRSGKSWGAILGLIAATVLHGVFNLLILFYANLAYSIFFVAGAGIVILFDFSKIKRDGKLLIHAT